jgi:subtilisin family serine protease
MSKFTRTNVLSAVLLAFFAAACSNTEPIAAPQRSFSPAPAMSRDVTAIAGRHIFVMSGGIPSDFAARVTAKGGAVVDNFAEVGTVITSGLSDADATALSVGGVVANDVTARWAPTPQELNASTATLDNAPSAADPTKPLNARALGLQWNMLQIQAPQAWAANKSGSPSVKVAILDSGIDPDHQELSGLVDLSTSARVVAGKTSCLFSNAKALWTDDFFHGTYVSGIVTSNNVIIAGVAPNVRLVAVKVLGADGSGSFSDIICGLQYAVIIAHAKVINMSLGATFKGNTPGLVAFQQFIAQFVDFAKSQGTVVVSASGNDDKNLGNPHPFLELPCEAGAQLCVSATSVRDQIAHYSNFGRAAIDVAAPGGEDKYLSKNPTGAEQVAAMILGPCAKAFCGTATDYLVADGTSAAAPHVSGLAALIASQNPMLSADGIMSLIRQTADNIGNQSKFGDGRINVARALGVQ